MTNLLLYYPITSIWAHADPVFSERSKYHDVMDPKSWNRVSNTINDTYARLQLELTARNWDFNIADDYYFERARIDGKEIVIGPQRFKAIVLPPLTTIRRTTLKKLVEFYDAGGTILAIGMLPDSSPEAGGNDTEIVGDVARLFGPQAGTTARMFSLQTNTKKGKAYYFASDVTKLIGQLTECLEKDLQIVAGSDADDGFLYQHREKLGRHYYWVVNDTPRPRINYVSFSEMGIPEKWDALTGERTPLFYVDKGDRTEVRLLLGPWDAYFVVFNPGEGEHHDAELVSTNAE